MSLGQALRRARWVLAPCALVVVATACTAIIGTRDLTYDPNADGGGTSSGNPPGPPGPPPPPGDGGGDAGNCVADLQNDPKNCGRCGHDCLGGACTMGVCQPKQLATALQGANSVAVDASYVYVSEYIKGRISRIPKDGSTQPVAIAAGRTNYAVGLWIDGTTLYWANSDSTLDVDAGNYGGIWKCTVPQCADVTIVTPDYDPEFPSVTNGTVYYASYGDDAVEKALADGGHVSLVTANRPLVVAADATHVYYTSSANDFLRVPVGGGASERVGPLNGNAWGYTRVDATNVYWAFWELGGAGHVMSIPKNDIAKTPSEFTTAADKGSIGIALDDTNIYWTNEGTFTTMSMIDVSDRNGEVRTCPKTGCPSTGSTVLAKGLDDATAITVDATAVYFIEVGDYQASNGVLKKVAKP